MTDYPVRAGIVADFGHIQPNITDYNRDLAHDSWMEVGEDETFEISPVYDLNSPSYIEVMGEEEIQIGVQYDTAIAPDPIEVDHQFQTVIEPHYARTMGGYVRATPNLKVQMATQRDLADSALISVDDNLKFDIDPNVDGVVVLDSIVMQSTPEVKLEGFRRTKMDTLAPSPDSTRLLIIEHSESLKPLHESQLSIGDMHLLGLESFGSRLDMYRLDFEVFTKSSYKNRVLLKQAHPYNRDALVSERMVGGATITNVSPHGDAQGTMDVLAAQIFIEPEDTLKFKEPIRLWYRARLSQKGLGEDYTVATGWFDLVH